MFQPRASILRAALLTATATAFPVSAANLYWDTNGATAASGNAATGTWDTGTNWSTDPTGAIATVGWTNGSSAVFSAGTDGVATKTVTLAGTIATPSILLEEVGLVNITGGTIDITGGATFNTSVLGATTGRSLTWTPVITGTGPLTLAVNGDTSATGNGSNTIFALTGVSDFTGDVTITSGVVNATSGLGNAANKVVLNGGGVLATAAGVVFPRNIEVGAAGGVIRTYGAATNFALQGTLSGSGALTHTDTGTAILTGSGTGFTGALAIPRGGMQIGDGTQTSNILANASGITVGDATGSGTLRYSLDTSFTLATPVALNNAGSVFSWLGKDAGDVLTINSVLGTNSANATLAVGSGAVTLASGANAKVASVSLTTTPANNAAGVVGTLNVGTGATLTTRYMGLGDASNTSGIINQSGGTVTLENGGNGFRLGHWTNGLTPGSVYNLSGGTFDGALLASNAGDAQLISVGWDGLGSMTVGGGGSAALLKAPGLMMDRNRTGTGNASSFTLATNGTFEIGSRGILSQGDNDIVNLSGGTMRSTASSTWAGQMVLGTASTSTFDIATGTTVTQSGKMSGDGNLNVTGAGNYSVSSLSNIFSGTLTRTGGTISGTGTVSGSPVINATIAPGVAAGGIGVINFGDTGKATVLNGPLALDLNATGDPVTSDLIAVFDGVTFGAGAVVSPVFSAPPVAATHHLIAYGGTRTGAPTIDPGIQVRGLSFVIDTASSPGEVLMNVTGTAAPANLIWSGDGVGNAWNVNSATNFGAQKYFQYDNVTFNDAGNNAANITITGTLTPGSITIDGTKAYTFSGSGSLVGAPLTKNSTGDLTILNDNKFGAVNITAGKVIVGNGGTTGSLGETGSINLPIDTTLEINRAGSLTYSRPAAAGSAGTLVKKGTGTLTIGAGATLLPTNVIVDGGTLNLQGGGFSANRMEGVGQLTVNPGATFMIASGFAHALGGDNGTMTEAVTINQGTLTLNQEQYFKILTLNGATVNGTADIRSATGSNWLVTGTTPTTFSNTVTNQTATNWTVEDVTSSTAPDLFINGTTQGGSATNKAGLGTMRVAGTMTSNGAVNINAGTYQAAANNALGFGAAIGNASVGVTTVAAGATLDINGVTVNEPVNLNNGGTLTNTNITATGTLSNGLAGVRVVDAGSGYTAAPTLAFTGGGGTGATATAVPASGALSTVATTAAGTGFTSAPTVTVTGVGVGATASATISQLGILGTGNQIGGEGNLSIPAVMLGSGEYTKVGAGTVTIPTGGSSFSGNLSVAAGTLAVTASGNGTTSGLGADIGTRVITLNGGTLSFGVNNVFGGGATLAANLPGIVVNPGATFATNNYNVIGALTLNGGTVTDTRVTAPGGYQGFELKGNVTVGGTTPSLITAAGTFGHHLVGTIGFDVADVAPGADLTVATKLLNSSADNASAAANLTKTGAGTLALNAANSYTGTTTVSAGVLSGPGSVTGPLVVEATGTIAPGASAGNFGAGTTTLAGTYACEIDGANEDTLVVTGDLDVTGGTLAITVLNTPALATHVIATYTGTRTGNFATVTGLPSGYSVNYNDAAKTIELINGGVTDPYAAYTSANGIPGALGSADSDGDGISNAIEFVLGTDPSGPGSNSAANLPKATVDATYLTIEYRRSDASMTMPLAQQPLIEYGSALTGWTTAVNGAPAGTPVVITVANDGAATGVDLVTVKIPRALATGAKLFARLRADIP